MGKNQEKSIELILNLISCCPQGVSMEEILGGVNPPIAKRTLQYYLLGLEKKGHLLAEGNARGRRYRIPLKPFGDFLTLSKIAKEIRESVAQPIGLRESVDYRRSFLDQYRPNETQYLPKSMQDKLLSMGKMDQERPAGTYAKQILHRLLIDLSWNSSRLEGNTYSLLDTEKLICSGQAAEGKGKKETQMILNHKAAIEFLVNSSENTEINRYTILNLHALLSDELLDDHSCGSLRKIPVAIQGSAYLPINIPQLVEECFEQILTTARAILNPFEQAFFLMVHLPYLQPFADVNKRVSRLAANIPFIRENLCPLSFVDVSEEIYIEGLLGVYEKNRVELFAEIFAWAYERSCTRYVAARERLGEPDPFRLRYRDLRKSFLAQIVRGQMEKQQAKNFVEEQAQNYVPKPDRQRFIDIVAGELLGLHEGNCARYGLCLNDYTLWRKRQ